jgi:hypothetical protein
MADRELIDIERELQARHNPSIRRQFSSTALEPKTSEYIEDLALPVESRGRMPLTQEKFVISENPQRVSWEREVRTALDQLSDKTAHRITAPMIYEWATGISIADLIEAEGLQDVSPRGGGQNGSANAHLRHINWVLTQYFGKGYKTKIAGREVGKAYKIRQGFRVRLKRPANLTLWPEWENGTLNP